MKHRKETPAFQTPIWKRKPEGPKQGPNGEAVSKTAGSVGALGLATGSASVLWNHMAETHGIHLLQSEENDIRHAANAGAEAEIRALKNLGVKQQMKADLFDYLCWLEDYCEFRKAALDGKPGDYLVLASDGTTCWGKTYAEAVRVAMEHDKQLFDATPAALSALNTKLTGAGSSPRSV